MSPLPDPGKQPKLEDKPTTSETAENSAAPAEDSSAPPEDAAVLEQGGLRNQSGGNTSGTDELNGTARGSDRANQSADEPEETGSIPIAESPAQGASVATSTAATDTIAPVPESDGAVTRKLSCAKCGLHVGSGIGVCPNDGTVLLDTAALVPKLAGEYEFIAEIGSGGMGVIYKARHLALNQLVAVKMLHAHRLDENSLLRFHQEARAMSSLDHPGIVRVRDFGVTESGQPHLILDFIQGDTLASHIEREGPLSVSDTIDVFIDVADALEHAHERGILHRDLKPSNIMLNKDSKGRFIVKIVDFGLAKIMDDAYAAQKKGLTQTGEVFGSPLYMSPEQASGEPLDFTSDIYALGCVLFEALTGTPPFNGKATIEILFQQLNDTPPTLKQASLGKSFPPEIEALVAQTLQKKRRDRFKSMTELKNALIDTKLGKRHLELQMPRYQSKRAHNDYKLLIVSVSCLVVAACFAGFAIFKPAPPPAPKPVPTADVFDKLPSPDDAAVQKITAAKNQKSIKLTGWVDDEALKAFDQCKSMEDVDLSRTSVNGEGLEHLFHLPIRTLNMRHSGIADVGLMKIGRMHTLEDLDIGRTNIKDDNLQYIVNLPHLKKLNVMETDIGDLGIDQICQIHTLESLNVKDNPKITSAGFAALSRLKNLKELTINQGQWESFLTQAPKFTALQSLFIGDVKMEKMGKNIFARLQSLPLQALTFHSVKVTDPQFLSLTKLPKLKLIQLVDKPEISATAVGELKRLMPGLEIKPIGQIHDIDPTASVKD